MGGREVAILNLNEIIIKAYQAVHYQIQLV